MADYIPASDAELDAWQRNFLSYTDAHLTELGLTAADLNLSLGARNAWATAFAAHIAAQAAAQNARTAKDDARDVLERNLRALVRRIQAAPSVSDAQRQSLGITVRDPSRAPAGAPTSRPVANVDAGQRMRHTIAFVDEGTPTSKAKPDGVMGAEIWVKVGGPPPIDPSECRFLSLDTRTPYVAEYDGADAGKTAYYLLRWMSTRSEPGPWSGTVSATIAG